MMVDVDLERTAAPDPDVLCRWNERLNEAQRINDVEGAHLVRARHGHTSRCGEYLETLGPFSSARPKPVLVAYCPAADPYNESHGWALRIGNVDEATLEPGRAAGSYFEREVPNRQRRSQLLPDGSAQVLEGQSRGASYVHSQQKGNDSDHH